MHALLLRESKSPAGMPCWPLSHTVLGSVLKIVTNHPKHPPTTPCTSRAVRGAMGAHPAGAQPPNPSPPSFIPTPNCICWGQMPAAHGTETQVCLVFLPLSWWNCICRGDGQAILQQHRFQPTSRGYLQNPAGILAPPRARGCPSEGRRAPLPSRPFPQPGHNAITNLFNFTSHQAP